MKVRVKVRDLLPNPHRHFEPEYCPTDPKKIAALEASIDKHEFWDGLVGRKSPTQPGKYEQGFGDARLKALRNRKGADFEILLTVLPLTDKHMLQMMADENDPAYDDHRDHGRECVRATKAYLVAHPTEWQRKKKANTGTGPSATDIAAVLGWTEAQVSHHLRILGAVERGKAPFDLVRPMPINTAEKFVKLARGKPRRKQEHLAQGAHA